MLVKEKNGAVYQLIAAEMVTVKYNLFRTLSLKLTSPYFFLEPDKIIKRKQWCTIVLKTLQFSFIS